MRHAVKKWLAAAGVLTLFGLVLFAGVMTANHWDFKKLSTAEYSTEVYGIAEEFDSVLIDSAAADIRFITTEDGTCTVECHEHTQDRSRVLVKDGVLTVEPETTGAWHWNFGIDFDSPSINIYLPAKEYTSLVIKEGTGDCFLPKEFSFTNADISRITGDITVFASVSEKAAIHATSGDITVDSASFGALETSVVTGTVTVWDVSCGSLLSDGVTGDLFLRNVTAKDSIRAQRTTGNVELENVDAAQVTIETQTGDITGTLRSEMVFTAHTATGDIRVPDTKSGGSCTLTTATGNIFITLTE